MRASRLSLSLAIAVLLATASSAAAHGGRDHQGHGGGVPAGVTEVATGLHNPRHLDVGPHGDVYVAEAGTGGGTASCFDTAEGFACVGATGRVSRIPDADELQPGARETVVDGLASFAPATGDDAIGPHGIDVKHGAIYVTNGGPTEPQRNKQTVLRDTLEDEEPVAGLFGRLLQIAPGGAFTPIADIWDFERDNNPDGQPAFPGGPPIGNPAIDSNAVDVLARHGHFYVADAGANTLLEVSRDGAIAVKHVFENVPTPGPGDAIIPMQAVPTGVVKGPDGLLYVGQLTGFPFPVGGANVFVIDPDTGAIVRTITGFTNAMDLAFGRDGTLYVLEIDANSLAAPGDEGAIFAVAPGATTGTQIPLPAGTLTAPGGIAAGRHGELYVTNDSTSGSAGSVLRIGLG
jgi:DNA-binding beta-propeller fold protein YncE